MMTPLEVLEQYWGYPAFRPMQAEIIQSVLSGHDTLGLLPTGGGKSLTFQVPALILPGVTLVVTPLISLMKDQVDNLRDRGIMAVMFHSGMAPQEKELAMTRCRLGKAKIAYLSPERLANREFQSQLRGVDVSLLVVDEAHCISQWGYDFRPSYLNIAPLRDIVGADVPVLALTASATPEVRDDIMRSLRFGPDAQLFAKSFARPNISYVVRYTEDKDTMMMRVLRGTRGTAIVYVRSRKRTRELADIIAGQGITAAPYHAGLEPQVKEERQNDWKADRVRVIVATNAFGMGIDKPDVRTVIHYDLPSSLEEYYQEAGRAGRDGLPSYAVALVSRYDSATLSRRVTSAFPEKEFIAHVYEMAGNFLDVAVGSGYQQLFEFSLERFCQTYNLPPVPTESALNILSRAGYVDYIAETTNYSRLMMTMRKDGIYSLSLPPVAEEVLQGVFRSYPGLFADYVRINEVTLSRSLMLSTQQVYEALLLLSRMHVLSYVPRRTTPYLYYSTSREEPRHLIIPREVYERQRERMEVRIEAVKKFAFAREGCRAKSLLEYFGETTAGDCGQCDLCRAKNKNKNGANPLRDNIIRLLTVHGPMKAPDLVATLGPNAAEAIRALADEGAITIENITVKLVKSGTD